MSFNLQYKSNDNSEIFNVNLGNYLPTIQIKKNINLARPGLYDWQVIRLQYRFSHFCLCKLFLFNVHRIWCFKQILFYTQSFAKSFYITMRSKLFTYRSNNKILFSRSDNKLASMRFCVIFLGSKWNSKVLDHISIKHRLISRAMTERVFKLSYFSLLSGWFYWSFTNVRIFKF